MAISALFYLCLFTFTDGFGILTVSIYSTGPLIDFAMIVIGVCVFVIGLPLAYVFSFILGMGLQGLFLGMLVASLLKASILIIYLYFNYDTVLVLPDDNTDKTSASKLNLDEEKNGDLEQDAMAAVSGDD